MSGHAGMSRLVLVFVFATVVGLTLAATAQAGEVVFTPQNNPPNAEDGWQAGTCNTPTCTPDSPKAEFYETTAGHPPRAAPTTARPGRTRRPWVSPRAGTRANSPTTAPRTGAGSRSNTIRSGCVTRSARESQTCGVIVFWPTR